MLDRDMDRAVALETLRAIHVQEVPPLLTALNHKDAKVRAFACESLGELGPEANEAGSALEQKAQAEAEPVRDAAGRRWSGSTRRVEALAVDDELDSLRQPRRHRSTTLPLSSFAIEKRWAAPSMR